MELNLCLCFFLGFILSSMYGQESSIKLYSKFDLFDTKRYPTWKTIESEPLFFNNLSLAYRRITKREWVHELEGSYSNTGLSLNDFQTKGRGYELRYSLGRYLWKSNDQKVRFLLSGASKLFLHKAQIFSNPDQLRSEITDVGLNLSVFTHLEIDLSKRFYLDINTSFLGMTITSQSWREVSSQSGLESYRGKYRFNALDQGLFRLGVGFRF